MINQVDTESFYQGDIHAVIRGWYFKLKLWAIESESVVLSLPVSLSVSPLFPPSSHPERKTALNEIE